MSPMTFGSAHNNYLPTEDSSTRPPFLLSILSILYYPVFQLVFRTYQHKRGYTVALPSSLSQLNLFAKISAHKIIPFLISIPVDVRRRCQAEPGRSICRHDARAKLGISLKRGTGEIFKTLLHSQKNSRNAERGKTGGVTITTRWKKNERVMETVHRTRRISLEQFWLGKRKTNTFLAVWAPFFEEIGSGRGYTRRLGA